MLSRRKLGLGLGAVGLLAGGLAAIPLASADAQTGSVQLTAAAPVLPACPVMHAPVVIRVDPVRQTEDRWVQLNVLVDQTATGCGYQGLHIRDTVLGPGRSAPDATGGTLYIARGR
jgi:hypothetical protein